MTNKKHKSLTLCISNGGQSTKNETNMNEINNGAIMKVSAGSPATTYTRDRYVSAWDILLLDI